MIAQVVTLRYVNKHTRPDCPANQVMIPRKMNTLTNFWQEAVNSVTGPEPMIGEPTAKIGPTPVPGMASGSKPVRGVALPRYEDAPGLASKAAPPSRVGGATAPMPFPAPWQPRSSAPPPTSVSLSPEDSPTSPTEEARQEEEKKAEPEKGARKEQPEEATSSEYSEEEEKKAEPEQGARKEQPEEETYSEYSEEEEQEKKPSAAGPGIKLGPSPQPGSQRVKTPRPCPKNGRQCANTTKQTIKQQILTQCQGTSSNSS